MGRLGGTVIGAVVLANAALAAGVAHSWVVQSGENPVKLTTEVEGTETLKLPRSGEVDPVDASEPEAGELPASGEEPVSGEAAASGEIGFEISVAEGELIYGLYESGEDVAFLDARLADEFEAGHVLGAYRLMAEELRDQAMTTPVIEFGAITPETRIVIYCGGGECEASHSLASYLQDFGFNKLHVMTEGFPAWEAAGLPTEAGPDPLTGAGE